MEIEMDKVESTSVDNFQRTDGSVLNFNSNSSGRKIIDNKFHRIAVSFRQEAYIENGQRVNGASYLLFSDARVKSLTF